MKLKYKMAVIESGGEIMAVPSDIDCDLRELVRMNRSAAVILECLKEETDAESIVSKLMERFDGNADEMRSGVELVLNKLRSAGLLDE